MGYKVKVSFTQYHIFCSQNDLNDLAVSYHALSLSEGQDASGADVGENIPSLPSMNQCFCLERCVCFSFFPQIEERIYKAGIS